MSRESNRQHLKDVHVTAFATELSGELCLRVKYYYYIYKLSIWTKKKTYMRVTGRHGCPVPQPVTHLFNTNGYGSPLPITGPIWASLIRGKFLEAWVVGRVASHLLTPTCIVWLVAIGCLSKKYRWKIMSSVRSVVNIAYGCVKERVFPIL